MYNPKSCKTRIEIWVVKETGLLFALALYDTRICCCTKWFVMEILKSLFGGVEDEAFLE